MKDTKKMGEAEVRCYFLYDGRSALGQGTEDAIVLSYCETRRRARDEAPEHGHCACYSYKSNPPRVDGGTGFLSDERWEWDFIPGQGFTDEE